MHYIFFLQWDRDNLVFYKARGNAECKEVGTLISHAYKYPPPPYPPPQHTQFIWPQVGGQERGWGPSPPQHTQFIWLQDGGWERGWGPLKISLAAQNCQSLNISTKNKKTSLKINAVTKSNCEIIFLSDTRLNSDRQSYAIHDLNKRFLHKWYYGDSKKSPYACV